MRLGIIKFLFISDHQLKKKTGPQGDTTGGCGLMSVTDRPTVAWANVKE